jgi:iron complex transport system substrate-binding protein
LNKKNNHHQRIQLVMKSRLLITTLLIIVLLTACAPANTTATSASVELTEAPAAAPTTPAEKPVTLTDQRGQEFQFEQPVQRIVSLAPSNTEILFAVGAGNQVVGRDTYSDYPAEASAVADIGGGFGALDTETILASTPDLVLAANLTPAEQIQPLEDLGLNVFVLGNPTDLPGMYENLRTVAAMTGHLEETEILITSLEERVTVVKEKLSGVTERPLVLYEIDGTDPNAPWVPGPGTFVDTLLSMAGGNNMSASLEGTWIQVSLETIIEMNPEIIMLGDAQWGGVTPEMVEARGGWDALTAVQEGKVYPFDDNLVSRPGPRMVDGLEALAKFLHPDLFE